MKVGDKVSSGDIIAEIETDKATMEFEVVDEGTVSNLMIEEGAEGVAVNSVIAILADELEAVEERQSVETPKLETNIETPKETKNREPKTSTTLTVREAIRSAMSEEMRRDDCVTDG